jgi:TRAP-type mannitol/chloroaromatic compound transport system permease small subunit
MPTPDKIFDVIDTVNEKIGGVLCYALLVLMLIQVMEVVLRYIFNNPTKWAWDVNGQIFSGIAMLAGAYALLHDTHVRLDIFYRGFSPRKRTMIELFSFPLAFLGLCFVLWEGVDMAWWSWKTNEHAHSYFAPILWPVKTCLPIAAFLMLSQSISRFGRLVMAAGKSENDQKGENE